MLTDAVDRIKRRPLIHRVRRWLGEPPPGPKKVGLVLGGGGARGAYQAGVLAYLGEFFPDVRFPILTGVSAGAINSAQLAQHVGGIGSAASGLVEAWRGIEAKAVYEPKSMLQMLRRIFWNPAVDSLTDQQLRQGQYALADTTPLRTYLVEALGAEADGRLGGIAENLREGALEAYGVITTNYATGQSVMFVEGQSDERWSRPERQSYDTKLTVDHIMASTALPLIFPAVRVGEGEQRAWYGDGGISLSSPLAPAIHLGADAILAIATRHKRSATEAARPQIAGYPPLAQVLGLMLGSVFNDTLDQDALMLSRINELLDKVPASDRGTLRPVNLCIIRPSRDLTQLARAFEVRLEGFLNFLTTSLGSADTRSPEWLSMILFQRAYVEQLMEVGYEDGRHNHARLEDFFARADAGTRRTRRVSIGSAKGIVEEALGLPKPKKLPESHEEESQEAKPHDVNSHGAGSHDADEASTEVRAASEKDRSTAS
jgi:NTE family protein